MDQRQSRIFKRRKFNPFINDDECQNCKRGPIRCCGQSIPIGKEDLNIDLSNHKNVEGLVNTGLFDVGPTKIHSRCYKTSSYENDYRIACIFWTTTGCRLDDDVRPALCRYYHCNPLKEGVGRGSEIQRWTQEEYKSLHYGWKLQRAYISHYEAMSYDEYLRLDWKELMKIL